MHGPSQSEQRDGAARFATWLGNGHHPEARARARVVRPRVDELRLVGAQRGIRIGYGNQRRRRRCLRGVNREDVAGRVLPSRIEVGLKEHLRCRGGQVVERARSEGRRRAAGYGFGVQRAGSVRDGRIEERVGRVGGEVVAEERGRRRRGEGRRRARGRRGREIEVGLVAVGPGRERADDCALIRRGAEDVREGSSRHELRRARGGRRRRPLEGVRGRRVDERAAVVDEDAGATGEGPELTCRVNRQRRAAADGVSERPGRADQHDLRAGGVDADAGLHADRDGHGRPARRRERADRRDVGVRPAVGENRRQSRRRRLRLSRSRPPPRDCLRRRSRARRRCPRDRLTGRARSCRSRQAPRW